MSTTPNSSTAKISPAKEGLKDKLPCYLFGEYLFISYSRRDTTTYAVGLADELASRNRFCKIDQWGTQPGRELPEPMRRTLRKSAVMVLISTKAATESHPVQKKSEAYRQTFRKPNFLYRKIITLN